MRSVIVPVFSLLVAHLLFPVICFCQLTVTPAQPAAVLAAKLAGPGIAILSPVLTCPSVANGTFISVSTPLTIDSGILLTTGKSTLASGPESFLASTNNGVAGDPALAALALTATLSDACILQFDFVPKGDTVSFNYQFGSEEYNHSTCGPYNDAFAFFISGPGIAGIQNMALIPGTTIPVTVNSVNSGIPGAGYTLANCTIMGPGSPFTTYFYDNTGGSQLTYKGFTKKLTALHSVTPCDTYHLKISICDAGNGFYDSGVFIEAGSLKTNSFTFNRADSVGATILGVPHSIVKGCAPATLTVLSAHTLGTSQTLHFTFGGTAIHGTDFTAPDSATIAAGGDSVRITITGLPTPPAGTKTLEVYVSSPFTCGIVDSITLNIIDSPGATILTPDTTICSGANFPIRVAGTPGLSYSWVPGTGLSSATAMSPIASPLVTTAYAMTATLPGSGCPDITKNINVTVINTSITLLTPDTSLCLGQLADIRVSGAAALSYSWTPATGLSNAAIQNPVATPTLTTTYTVTATAAGGLCPSTAALTITVSSLNISVLTPDTTICYGASFGIRATGTPGPGPVYTWSPGYGLSSAAILQPVASPTVATSYSLTASWPGSGCPDVSGSVHVSVINASIQLLTPDTAICAGASVNIQLAGSPTLLYSWAQAGGLDNPFAAQPVASPMVTTTYTVTATDSTHTCFSSASLTITVGNPDAAILSHDTSVCKGSFVQMMVRGNPGLVYSWSPAAGLSDPNIMNPVAYPAATAIYTLTVSVPGTSCVLTDTVSIHVVNPHLTNVTSAQTIAYGSSVHLNADNAAIYMWVPDDGSLDNANISDPVATPKAPVVYTVYGIDKYGCSAADSVKIDLTYDNIFIPDAFTPNNDGLNDVFRVGNLGFYKLVTMNVYNRWGELIFHANDGNNKGWDGTCSGTRQDMGVYSYMIILAKPDGVLQTFKGNVTLIK